MEGQAPPQSTKSVVAEVPGTTVESEAVETAGVEPGEAAKNAAESKWDAETKDYIGKLRSENAKWRTQTRDLESKFTSLSERLEGVKGVLDPDSNVAPEDAFAEVQAQNETLTVKTAILEAAYENGVPHDKLPYFSYLIETAASQLGEDEELDLEAILQEVNKGSAPTQAGGATKSVPTGNVPEGQGSTEITVDEFKKMGFLAKSRLQMDQPEVYDRLKKESFGR